jgi:hypothetical protein
LVTCDVLQHKSGRSITAHYAKGAEDFGHAKSARSMAQHYEVVIDFQNVPRKALHSIFETAARVIGSESFVFLHERLPNDALLLTKSHFNLWFSHHYCEDNMSSIPFENQRLPVNLVEQIEHDLAQGKAVSGDVLLRALEQSGGHQLDDRCRDMVRRFSVSAVKRRGRPTICKGPEDFTLEEVDAQYPALLRKHEEEAQQRRLLAAAEGTILPSAEPTPSELAYTQILKDMQADFPTLHWETLRNKHSEWKTGHFHSAENEIDSEDYDAEIERLFPPAPES